MSLKVPLMFWKNILKLQIYFKKLIYIKIEKKYKFSGENKEKWKIID